MTEAQRESVPLNDGGELDTALAFLAFARNCVIKKLDGLDEEQVRRVLVPSGTSLLGLVRHLTDGERYWFGYRLTGQGAEPDWDAGMAAGRDVTRGDVIAGYRAAIADSDAAIRELGDPGARSALAADGAPRTLRWTLAHMTSETARHAGHADILREQLDGTTGR
ncbi:MAG TPA: DinB family protein [Jatrophihabitans sp.]|nr:DinB family protein [Jatrophihabitans sp.]